MAATPESSPKKKSSGAQLTTATAAMPANSSKFSIQSLLGLGEGGSGKPSRGGSVSSNTSEDDVELQYDAECSGELLVTLVIVNMVIISDRRDGVVTVFVWQHTRIVGCRAAASPGKFR